MKWPTGILVAAILVSGSIGSTHADSLPGYNRWNALSATGFTQGFVRTECQGQPTCQEDDYSLGGDSHASCSTSGSLSPGCFSNVYSWPDWIVHGSAGDQGYGDVVNGTWAEIQGQRVDGETFLVGGDVSGWQPHATETVEIAVFYFPGDPAVFDGVEVDSVYDLVSAGFIPSGYVLGVTTIEDGSVDFEVDVQGINNSDLVLFASGRKRPPSSIPAFVGIASNGTGYCFARASTFVAYENPDNPWVPGYYEHCEDHDFQGGNCMAGCDTESAGSQVAGTLDWTVSGSTYWDWDGLAAGSIAVQGQFVSEGTFLISGSQDQSHDSVRPQVAVFRYSGSPGELNGLEPFSVFDLVRYGLIAEDDVLFVRNFEPDDLPDFSHQVDVGGIAEDEIYVFARQQALRGQGDGTAVPAVGSGGIGMMVLAILGAGTWALRSSSRRTR